MLAVAGGVLLAVLVLVLLPFLPRILLGAVSVVFGLAVLVVLAALLTAA